MCVASGIEPEVDYDVDLTSLHMQRMYQPHIGGMHASDMRVRTHTHTQYLSCETALYVRFYQLDVQAYRIYTQIVYPTSMFHCVKDRFWCSNWS